MSRCLTVALALLPGLCAAQVMAMGLTSKMTLLEVPEVQRELKVTAEQDSLIRAKRQELRGVPDTEGLNDMQHPFRTFDRELVKLLDEKQRRRLHELFLQENGLLSLSESDVTLELGLKAETQALAIETIDGLMHKVMAHLAELPVGGKFDAKKVESFKRDAHVRLSQLLTPEEAKKWERMKGKPFKFPKSMRRTVSGGFCA